VRHIVPFGGTLAFGPSTERFGILLVHPCSIKPITNETSQWLTSSDTEAAIPLSWTQKALPGTPARHALPLEQSVGKLSTCWSFPYLL
jgi:hypothetical protein